MKSVFIHIPKTAGTTFKDFLGRNHDLRRAIELYGDRQCRFSEQPAYQQREFDLISGHFHYGAFPALHGHFNFFSLVRDPISRIVSYYNWMMWDVTNPEHLRLQQEKYSFELFLEERPEDFFNDQVFYVGGKDSVHQSAADALERSLQRLGEYRFIGVVEFFDVTVAYLAREMNWKPIYISGNQSKDKMVTSLTAAQRKLLRKATWADQILYRHVLDRFFRTIARLDAPSGLYP